MTSSLSWHVWAERGKPVHPECVELSPGTHCWVCGAPAARGMTRDDWQGHNFVGQNRVRCWTSKYVCEPCVIVMARKSPMAPRPAKGGVKACKTAESKKLSACGESTCKICGKAWEAPQWRNYSVMFEVNTSVVIASKGEKGVIREWLRAPKKGEWWAAISDTGQKHVIPWAPRCGADEWVVLFEEAEVRRGEWKLLDDVTALLDLGVSEREISAGDYSVRTWQQHAQSVKSFEETWAAQRASEWWRLCLWLAQPTKERVFGHATDKRRGDPAPRQADRVGAVPAKRGTQREEGQRPRALEPDPKRDVPIEQNKRVNQRVDHVDKKEIPAGGSLPRQLSLFT